MADDKELRQRMQRLAGLVRELESIADPQARSAATELIQLVMDLHGAAIERILEKIYQAGRSGQGTADPEIGQQIIDSLGADPIVSGLLVLYGLHPQDSETRVAQTLERVARDLRSHSTEAELVSMTGGAVRIRVRIGAHACGSTATTVRTLLEDAIYEAAPDIASLTLEGLEEKSASGFVSLEKLLGNAQLNEAVAHGATGD